ncbi:unnamed protein product, partial [Bubo scandiacus]
ECHLVEHREDCSHQKSRFKVVRTFSHQRFYIKKPQQNVTTKVHPAAGQNVLGGRRSGLALIPADVPVIPTTLTEQEVFIFLISIFAS